MLAAHPCRPPFGAHILQIYLNDSERRQALVQDVVAGLHSGERVLVVQRRGLADLAAPFPACELPLLSAALATGGVRSRACLDHYFPDSRFDPERATLAWRDFYLDSARLGYPAARAVGDVPVELERLGGLLALAGYENGLHRELDRFPPSRILCQYDARGFSAASLLVALRAHPWVLVGGRVEVNPFFLRPRRRLSH